MPRSSGDVVQNRQLVRGQERERHGFNRGLHVLGQGEAWVMPLDALRRNQSLQRMSGLVIALQTMRDDSEVGFRKLELGNILDEPERGDPQLFDGGKIVP